MVWWIGICGLCGFFEVVGWFGVGLAVGGLGGLLFFVCGFCFVL